MIRNIILHVGFHLHSLAILYLHSDEPTGFSGLETLTCQSVQVSHLLKKISPEDGDSICSTASKQQEKSQELLGIFPNF